MKPDALKFKLTALFKEFRVAWGLKGRIEVSYNLITRFTWQHQVLKSALVKWENSKDPFKIVIEKENSMGGYTKVRSTLTPIYNNGLLQRLIMVDEINNNDTN